MKRYDIAIVGGGPAGATLAALAAGAGWSAAVVEKAEFPRRKVCGEFLSATTIPILARLGLDAAYCGDAGPEIRRVGFFSGDLALAAEMPAAKGAAAWGRALGRESLDTMLLRRAAALGADVFQPWSATEVERAGGDWLLRAGADGNRESVEIAAPLIVAAHGSWESGGLPSQPPRRRPRAGDLFGFKAHFRGTSLPRDLMPLLVFPGGYGGMVAVDGGRTSLSCCVRRDRLAALRRHHPGARAGETVLAHITATTKGVRDALEGAALAGAILASGPIRPGLRPRARQGLLAVGNAAGEAHPIVAEGIGMAMQSAVILFGCLERERDALRSTGRAAAVERVGRDYSRRWRSAFAPRILASAGIAALALHAPLAAAMRGVIGLWPRALTAGAYAAGKTKLV